MSKKRKKQKKRTYHAYDRALTLLFSHPIMMETLIKGFVPQAWTKDLDFSSLRTINVKHTTEQLRRRENDVIWAIKLKDQTIYIVCILEFQSSIDKFMALRLMTYIGLTCQELIKQETNALVEDELLPPVFPLVLYTGSKPWDAPRCLIECFSTKIPKSLLKYQPSLEFLVLDIGRLDLDCYNIDDGNVAATFIELERANKLTSIKPIVDKLILQLQSAQYDSLRRSFISYVNRAWQPKKQLDSKEFVDFNEVSTMLREKFEQWRNEARQEIRQEIRQEVRQEIRQEVRQEIRQEVRQECMQEGLQEGLQKGSYRERLMLSLKFLEYKFPTAPDSVKKSIRKMPVDALSGLFEKIAKANALEDIMADLQVTQEKSPV